MSGGVDGYSVSSPQKLYVIISCGKESDGRKWKHVSLSFKDKLPSYEDMKQVKDLFIGAEEEAIQVFPRRSEFVNHHPYVLHLWHCMDGRVLPDFRKEIGNKVMSI